MQVSPRRPIGVATMFATNGISISSVLPWYPTFKDNWELSDLVFGLLVTAVALGSLASTTLPAWAERTFGARRVMIVGTVITAFYLVGIGLAPGAWALAVLLLFFGLTDAIIDVSQNVAAVRVQTEMGRSIMSSLHACWSLGAVLGGIGGTAAAVAGVPILVHLSAIAVLQVGLVALAAWLMGDVSGQSNTRAPADSQPAEPSSKITRRVVLLALPAAIVATAGTMVEDIGNNWAALSASTLSSISISAAGSAYIVLFAAQTVGRFAGDLLINRFGRVAVARAGGVCIALGGLAVVLATNPVPLYVGYALAGWGCATLVPSAYAASAMLPGVAQSTGMTVVSWLMRVGFMATSPLIGALAEATSLRVALVILPLAGLAVVLSAPGLRGHKQKTW
ncbi:MFS transporter [Corynebacterium lubricantis]|uniref:MFS transporter n=1 Tax=Corynebacterium lubricantis TaxID=541095 RepID=UPI001FE18532|nr:MFS transporter [Corynebacterium lubricantis]